MSVASSINTANSKCPVIIQRSEMDCGPAVVTCLLRALGVEPNYAELQEICTTDETGTNIDMLVESAARYGLELEEQLIHPQHVVRDSSLWPAIVVATIPQAPLHFMVMWSATRGKVRYLDPANGVHTVDQKDFVGRLYRHTVTVPLQAWFEDAKGAAYRKALEQRMQAVKIRNWRKWSKWVEREAGPYELARFEGCVATIELRFSLDKPPRNPSRMLEALYSTDHFQPEPQIPQCTPTGPGEDGEPMAEVRGVILLKMVSFDADLARQRSVQKQSIKIDAEDLVPEDEDEGETATATAAPDDPDKPSRLGLLSDLLRTAGLRSWVPILLFSLVGAAMPVLEAVAYRMIFGTDASFFSKTNRGVFLAAIFGLFMIRWFFSLTMGLYFATVGARLSGVLRAFFHTVLAKLSVTYYSRRSIGDVVDRYGSVLGLTTLPQVAAQALAALTGGLATMGALIWLAPGLWWLIIFGSITPVVVGRLFSNRLFALSMKVENQQGGVTATFHDAIVGAPAARASRSRNAMLWNYENMLARYAKAALDAEREQVVVSMLTGLINAGVSGGLVYAYVYVGYDPIYLLLFIYWALQLPSTGITPIVNVVTQTLPQVRSWTERFFEPFDALYNEKIALGSASVAQSDAGVLSGGRKDLIARPEAADFLVRNLWASSGGVPILKDVTFRLPKGKHVAVVGESGAGKSTLVRAILGIAHVDRGSIHIDGEFGTALDLGRALLWLDPDVQLWNRSLIENIRYGVVEETTSLGDDLQNTKLLEVVSRLPQGLSTIIGESGRMLSGGEGMRTRAARALGIAEHARLAILDEPFRGLERPMRRHLLTTIRERLRDVTMFCVTHDIEITTDFDLVLVVENGRVVEAGHPESLLQNPTRYRKMLDIKRKQTEKFWSNTSHWKQLVLEEGKVSSL